MDTQQITDFLSSGKILLPLIGDPGSVTDEQDEEMKSENQRTNEHHEEVLSDSSHTSETCAELTRLAQVQSSLNSGVSVGTQHNGCKSVDVAVQADARDIAIQTLSSFELEIEHLDQSIEEIQQQKTIRQNCVSQGTQMSPFTTRRTSDYKNSKSVINDSNKLTDVYVSNGICANKRYSRGRLKSDNEEEKESLLNDCNNVKIVNSR